jgi:hypothetical protein
MPYCHRINKNCFLPLLVITVMLFVYTLFADKIRRCFMLRRAAFFVCCACALKFSNYR